MRISGRIVQLERAAKASGMGVCRLCYGRPRVTIHERLIDAPNGPGCSRIRDPLDAEDQERLTADLRCRRCAKPAEVLILLRPGLN